MNITLNIEAGNPIELQEAITGLAGIMGGAVAHQSKLEKAKPNGKGTTKPEKQPDPVVEPTVTEEAPEDKLDQVVEPDVPAEETSEETVVEETPETVSEVIPTVVELRAAAQTKGGTPEGKKAIKALLDEIGSKNMTEIPEDKRAAFIQRLGAL